MNVDEYANISNMIYDGVRMTYMKIHNTTPQTCN